MSLFGEDPITPPVRPQQPVVNETPYKGVTNDVQTVPVSTLLTAIEGRRWIVEWYSQILNTDNETAGHERSRSGIYQQYKLIHNLELKVTTPLPRNPPQDINSQEFEIRGQANMYPGVIPNPDDHFTATLADGRKGLFKILPSIETKTAYTQTTYAVEYVLIAWVTDARMFELNDKVVREYYFIRDFLDTGLNPVITVEAYGQYESLLLIREQLPQEYMREFFNQEFSTLTIPDQGDYIYDPFLTLFVTAIFTNRAEGVINGLNVIAVNDGRQGGHHTVLDALLELNKNMIPTCEAKIPIIGVHAFLVNPYYGGIRYSGIPWVVYPIKSNREELARSGLARAMQTKLKPGKRPDPTFRVSLNRLFESPTLGTAYAAGTQDIKPVTADDFYIFTEEFYAQEPGQMSLLESMVWEAIERDMVNPEELLRLIESSRKWSRVEQFYYQPIMYAMIPSALRGLP